MACPAWTWVIAPWLLLDQAPRRLLTARPAYLELHSEQVGIPQSKLNPGYNRFFVILEAPAPEINDRIIVKSASGSRAGILRFKGEPSFASGIWCGVEFDEPVGKNDGTVGGRRWNQLLKRRRQFQIWLFEQILRVWAKSWPLRSGGESLLVAAVEKGSIIARQLTRIACFEHHPGQLGFHDHFKTPFQLDAKGTVDGLSCACPFYFPFRNFSLNRLFKFYFARTWDGSLLPFF